MHSPLRIAILECDELVGETREEHGSLGDFYKRFLEAGASKLGEGGIYEQPEIEMSFFDVVKKQEYPNLEDIDAVLLSGSRYDAFTPGFNNWISNLVGFIKSLLQDQSRVRVMAVCFGHQIVGRAFGIMPERNEIGWEISVTPISLTERGQQVFGQDSLALHQMHRDVIPRYPPSVEKLGHSARCHVQGIYVKDRVITLQGHPEYTAKFASQLIDKRRGTLLDETTYLDGKSRVNDPHDGVIVGAGFLKFLMQN